LKPFIRRTYHLKPLLHGSSALKVGGGGADVPLDGLLRQINHVGGEEGLSVKLEVSLIGIEHTIQPREELLGAVVGVKDDGDVVGGSNATDVVGSGNGTSNGTTLVTVGNTLTGEESSTTLGELQDNGALLVTGSLEGSDHSGRGGHVLSWLVYHSEKS
jgi:hypothetical protein